VALNLYASMNETWWVISSGFSIFPLFITATIFGWLTDQIRRHGSELSNQRHIELAGLVERQREKDRELERLRILSRMAAMLNQTLDYQRVLEMALDLAGTALSESNVHDARLKSAVLLFDDGRLRIASAHGLSQADLRGTLPAEYGVIQEALSSGQVCVSHDPPRDAELQRLTGFHTTRVAICLPLAVGLEVYGVMLFGHRRPDFFTPQRLELLETVAQQSMIALQNARLYQDLEGEKEKIVEIQEEARKKLARDLHDGPTQTIAAIAMRLNFARRLVERDPKATLEELERIEDLARKTTKEIRQMLFTLRPLILESQGLVPALQQLAAKMHEAHGQLVMVEATPDATEGLEQAKQGVMFFIAEEAVNNARKHSHADRIWMRLWRKDDLCFLEIEDDGVGFNLGAIDADYEQRGSLGLVNLRERALLVNGVLEIDSREGKGTKILLRVPRTQEIAESMLRPGFTNGSPG